MINILSCYWAIIIQYCNFKYIMNKLGYTEYEDYIINDEDVKYNVRLNTSHLVNETCTEIYDNAINTLFSNKSLVNWDITACYRLKSFLDITFVMNKINFDWNSLLFVDNENKHIRNGICNLLFNFSIAFCTSEDSEASLQIIALVNELIPKEVDKDNLIALLKTLANLFVIMETNRLIGKDMDIGEVVKGINSGDEIVKELKEYVLLLLQ